MTELRQPPPAICTDCGSNRNIAQCIACGQPVCPSHRYGLGSLSDGYTCTNCPAFGFVGAATTPQPGRRLAIQQNGKSLWAITGITSVVVVLIILLFALALAAGHTPK